MKTIAEDAVHVNDLVSIIDTVCPYKPGSKSRSCGYETRDNMHDLLHTGDRIIDYARTTHQAGIPNERSIEALDTARKIILEQGKPSLYGLPGLVLQKATEILGIGKP